VMTKLVNNLLRDPLKINHFLFSDTETHPPIKIPSTCASLFLSC
jgi:hypothetical protein